MLRAGVRASLAALSLNVKTKSSAGAPGLSVLHRGHNRNTSFIGHNERGLVIGGAPSGIGLELGVARSAGT
jgi:hypothetical protein